MNILMLGRWLPPPRRPVRATREYQLARHLASKHHVTLAFITDNPDAVGAISALRAEFGDLEFASVPRAWKSLASAVKLAAGESCTLSYFRSEALRTRLADRLRRTRYDLILVSTSSMIQYALEADPDIPMLVDFAEVDSEWWMRRAAQGPFPATRFFRAEAMRLRVAETTAAGRAARCLVGSDEAARIVQSLAPGAPITVLPNGVDVEFFGSSPRYGQTPTVIVNSVSDSEAKLSREVEFCRHLVPTLRTRIPGVRVVVACKDAVRVDGALARRVGVEIAAPVSDLRSLLHSRAVGVAALAEPGTATRDSVLELMAAGVPVVATTGAVGQLRAVAGRDIQIADDAADFATHVVRLLEDDAGRVAMGSRGRAYVATHHAWSVVAAGLGEIVESLTAPRTPPTTALPDGTTMPMTRP